MKCVHWVLQNLNFLAYCANHFNDSLIQYSCMMSQDFKVCDFDVRVCQCGLNVSNVSL